ncbi:Nuclear receptor 2C2-associated protein [Coemansia sp. Benny D115]|nr:Nuclear receptor 2C2-associated protein [Coemansia sp. Benny D115]
MTAASLTNYISKSKVSSVLNKDTKSFGRQFLFDGNAETCWNSEQGTPQSILVEFSQPVRISQVRIQFQGGFAGNETWLVDAARGHEICPLYTEDNNRVQQFELPESEQAVDRTRLKIVFLSSTDFYGRIVVYALDFIGCISENPAASNTKSSGPTGDGEVAASVVII